MNRNSIFLISYLVKLDKKSRTINWFFDYKKSITYFRNVQNSLTLLQYLSVIFLVVLGADKNIDFDVTARKSGSINDEIEDSLLLIWRYIFSHISWNCQTGLKMCVNIIFSLNMPHRDTQLSYMAITP